MERNYELVLLDRLIELRRNKDELIEEIDGLNIIINHFTKFIDDPDNEFCLKAQKDLPIAELKLKNLVEQINMLEKRYRINYLPETLPENERHFPPPRVVPQDQGYEIPNGLLGVRRDLFNKLGTHRWAHDDDLQQMYGISQRPAGPWKDHFGFKLKRAQIPKK